MHPAIAAGVAANEEEAVMLEHAAALVGADVRDLATAIGRSDAMRLDNLGLHVQVPNLPLPEPDPRILEHFQRVYGDPDAALRTATAIERIRQGLMTPRLAREEWQRRTLAAAQEAASR